MTGRGMLQGAAAVGLLVSLAAAVAADDGPTLFHPTKDMGGNCNLDNTNHVSTGANVAVRTDTFCSAYYADFDRDALRSYIGGDALSNFRVRFSFVPRRGGNNLNQGWYWLYSWYTGCDWAEGDGVVAIPTWSMQGDWNGWLNHKYNWTKAGGTPTVSLPAGTKWYAKTYYTDTDGVPNTGDETVDAVNSQAWLKPDGTPIPTTFPGWSDPDPRGLEEYWFDACDRLNSAWVEPGAPPSGQPWNRYQMPVDDAVLTDLLDPTSTGTCAGIRVNAYSKAAYTPTPGTRDPTGYINLWLFTREASAVADGNGTPTGSVYDYRPHLDIRRKGDATCNAVVDVLDLARLANNFGKTSAAWEDADFNGDGTVDVLDLAAIANNFGWDGSGGSGGEVPEPVTALLLVPPAVWLGRRRRGGGRLP